MYTMHTNRAHRDTIPFVLQHLPPAASATAAADARTAQICIVHAEHVPIICIDKVARIWRARARACHYNSNLRAGMRYKCGLSTLRIRRAPGISFNNKGGVRHKIKN